MFAGEMRPVDPIRQLEADLRDLPGTADRFPRTAKLVAAGPAQQAKKLVEEAAELAIEAVRMDRAAAVNEAADLVYNLAVLLGGMNVTFDEVCAELSRRRGLYGIAEKLAKPPKQDAAPAGQVAVAAE